LETYDVDNNNNMIQFKLISTISLIMTGIS